MPSFQDLEVAFERCFLRLLGVYELQPEATTDPTLSELGNTLGIRFITSDQLDCADLSYDAPTRAQLQKVIQPLVFELTLYPEQAMRRTRIEQIIICSDLVICRKRAAGTLKVGLHYVDTLFIDAQAFRDDRFGRNTIHHELFHAIDFRDSFSGYVDTDWPKLQGPDFAYELDSAALYHIYKGRDPEETVRPQFDDPYDWLTAGPSNTPGFLTEYAKYSVVEDKAEVFSHMMTSYRRVVERAEHDAALNRKITQMKKLLVHFCNELDDNFWLRIADLKR